MRRAVCRTTNAACVFSRKMLSVSYLALQPAHVLRQALLAVPDNDAPDVEAVTLAPAAVFNRPAVAEHTNAPQVTQGPPNGRNADAVAAPCHFLLRQPTVSSTVDRPGEESATVGRSWLEASVFPPIGPLGSSLRFSDRADKGDDVVTAKPRTSRRELHGTRERRQRFQIPPYGGLRDVKHFGHVLGTNPNAPCSRSLMEVRRQRWTHRLCGRLALRGILGRAFDSQHRHSVLPVRRRVEHLMRLVLRL